MIESESVHFRQEITCHGSNGCCVDSGQVISSFVGFMFGSRQCKENYLVLVCLYTQIMPFSLYPGKMTVCIVFL